jgi:hypothetical protein
MTGVAGNDIWEMPRRYAGQHDETRVTNDRRALPEIDRSIQNRGRNAGGGQLDISTDLKLFDEAEVRADKCSRSSAPLEDPRVNRPRASLVSSA